MPFAFGLGGIVVALAFLTFAVYKGWSILYSSILGVIIIALTNGMNLYEALTVNYVSSFTSYAANYFILFCEGAMLGKLYDVSGAAWKIGKTVVEKCGTKFALVGYIAVAAILEYGGISTFVICFVLLPLAKPIFKETGTPWYMWPAITIVPIIGPELMTPGGLQTHNIIPTEVLGTNLMAAPVMGIVFTVVYFAICGLYFAWELKRSKNVEWKRNSLPPVEAGDIVITGNGGHPLDQNLYQSPKAASTAATFAGEDGVIILCCSCSDGVGGTHFQELMQSGTPEQINARLAAIPADQTIPEQWCAQIYARILRRHRLILVSDGLDPDLVARLNMTPAPTLADALALARRLKGPDARIIVIPDGVNVVPAS